MLDACAMQCSLRLSDYQIVHMACLWIKFSLRYYPIGHYNPLRMSQQDVRDRTIEPLLLWSSTYPYFYCGFQFSNSYGVSSMAHHLT